MAELDLTALGRMKGTCAIIALTLITVKTVNTLNIDQLLEVKITLMPLILELLVKVLVVLATIHIVRDLLLKVCLIFN